MAKIQDLREGDQLRRAARGDEDAFAHIYRAHQARLYRYALRMSGSAWVAEEIVQEVFLTLLREPGKFDSARGPLGAYLFGISRNLVLKRLERAPREVPLETDDEINGGVNRAASAKVAHMHTPAAWAERRQLAEQVREAVMSLPPEFREAVVLCELEELSYEEAAQMLECPIGTIRSRLHRARALLLAKLEMWRSVPRRATAR